MSVRLPGTPPNQTENSQRDFSLISRALPSSSFLNPLQSHVDGLVGGFTIQATDWRSLAAILSGGMAYRMGRVGMLGLGNGAVTRTLSVGLGLGAEVSAFETTHRALQDPASNPNRWRWSGTGGVRQGLLQSLLTFGSLKGAGRFARGENLFIQHLLQDTAMVGAHQASGALGWAPRPAGSLAEQFLHAEATNLQLGAGMALTGRLAPGLEALERGLDFSLSRPEVQNTANLFRAFAPLAASAGAGRRSFDPRTETGTWMSQADKDRDCGAPNPGEMESITALSRGEMISGLIRRPARGTETSPSGEEPQRSYGDDVFPPANPDNKESVSGPVIPRQSRIPSPVPEPLVESIIENDPIMVLVTDSEGQIVYANGEARKNISHDVVGSRIGDFLDVEGSPQNIQYRLRSDHERKFLWEDRPHPSAANMTVHYFLDITGREEKERLQDQVLRLKIEAAEGFLARGVIHDARNPMAIALLLAEYLERLIKKDHPNLDSAEPKDWDNLETYKDNPLAILAAFRSNLLRSSAILATGLNILRGGVKDLSLDGVLADIISQNVPIWIRKQIQWRTQIGPDIGIYGNRQGISRVLQNLLENACNAMPNGGLLTINAFIKDRKVIVEISDTGVGIPQENLDRIFEKDFTTGENGSGLGLPMARRIIEEMHGGKIEVETEVGRGSTFRLILPHMKSEPPAPRESGEF